MDTGDHFFLSDILHWERSNTANILEEKSLGRRRENFAFLRETRIISRDGKKYFFLSFVDTFPLHFISLLSCRQMDLKSVAPTCKTSLLFSLPSLSFRQARKKTTFSWSDPLRHASTHTHPLLPSSNSLLRNDHDNEAFLLLLLLSMCIHCCCRLYCKTVQFSIRRDVNPLEAPVATDDHFCAHFVAVETFFSPGVNARFTTL